MQRTVIALALIIMAGCGGKPPGPTAQPAQPASDDKPSVELKLDTQDGAIEFKKDEGGGGDSVDVEVKTK